MLIAVPYGAGGGGGGGVTDHGALTGLADDDHGQYILDLPATASRNVISVTTSANLPVLTTKVTDSTTASVLYPLRVSRNTSGAAGANGIGSGIEFLAETSTLEDQRVGALEYRWLNANNSARIGQIVFKVYDFTERVGLRISANNTSVPSLMIGTESTDAKLAIFLDGSGPAIAMDCNTGDGLSYIRVSRFGDPFQWVGVAGPTYSAALDTIGANDLFIRSQTTGNYVFATTNKFKHVTGGTVRATVDSDGVTTMSQFNLGDPATDGSWRLSISGTDLLIQRRESASWVTKQTIPA